MKKEYYILFFFLLIGFTAFAFKKKTNKIEMPFFGKILKGKQKIRPCDLAGCGYFGADRDDHIHKGVDVIAPAGTKVYAPISGTVRRLFVYPGRYEMKGIEISQGDWQVKLFYLETPFQTGEFVDKGDFIGYVQNVSKYHNYEDTMTNHTHIEIRFKGKIIDPTQYILN